MPKAPKISLHILQYLQKSMVDEVDFLLVDKDILPVDKNFLYKLIVSLWLCVAGRAQSPQNNNFIISLQYLKEKVNNEAYFLPADKRQSFLYSDTISLDVRDQACRNCREWNVCYFAIS